MMMMMMMKCLCNGWLSLQQVIQSIWVTLCPTCAGRDASQQQPVSASVSIKARWKLKRKRLRVTGLVCFISLCVLSLEKLHIHVYFVSFITHIRKTPGGNVCKFPRPLCHVFHLRATSREINHQIYWPEPHVIQLGCGLQLLVWSHSSMPFCKRPCQRSKCHYLAVGLKLLHPLLVLCVIVMYSNKSMSSLHSIGGHISNS